MELPVGNREYFKQQSRVSWLRERDQNVIYFFRMVQTRMNFNFI